MEPPSTPRPSKHLTRDQRLRVLCLAGEGYTYSQIASRLGCTKNQVRYTTVSQKPTPKKSSGRKPKLSKEQLDSTIEWIRSSFDNRAKSCNQIAAELHLPVCGETLRKALKSRGMEAHPAVVAPAAPPFQFSGKNDLFSRRVLD
ncbi:uncharacterized protein N7503_009188 [Penicillium pulvis]|uniref:uncharacterized protein n=1 Tax=Penicillium pulvis TaxID=1562058 RepID=UPI002549272E|nr:uncharacterized protein N7503_009188 [Penicillium pulvis]KAJ5793210.1 hypothetical protein N7503_009188 [Penicillium pulvis]